MSCGEIHSTEFCGNYVVAEDGESDLIDKTSINVLLA
jgi:hypothetical protein